MRIGEKSHLDHDQCTVRAVEPNLNPVLIYGIAGGAIEDRRLPVEGISGATLNPKRQAGHRKDRRAIQSALRKIRPCPERTVHEQPRHVCHVELGAQIVKTGQE